MNLSKISFAIIFCTCLTSLTGCVSTYSEERNSAEYQPVSPMTFAPQQQTRYPSGAIYNSAQAGLFATDRRASRIGDILTVSFAENFQATKSQNAANNKATGFDLDMPNILGLNRLESSLSAGTDQSFSGSGSAAQSNSLTGQMSVTVARVFEGGNLEILGQKKLTLNNGDEYIRVRGIVRPEDISSNNVISSDRIANAEIKYIGAGDVANTAKAGWLQRILTDLSPY
jgi:flagellar L-ring protein precursor FlgH